MYSQTNMTSSGVGSLESQTRRGCAHMSATTGNAHQRHAAHTWEGLRTASPIGHRRPASRRPRPFPVVCVKETIQSSASASRGVRTLDGECVTLTRSGGGSTPPYGEGGGADRRVTAPGRGEKNQKDKRRIRAKGATTKTNEPSIKSWCQDLHHK